MTIGNLLSGVTSAVTVGDGISGATATRVLFVGAGGVLADDDGMTWNSAANTLTAGSAVIGLGGGGKAFDTNAAVYGLLATQSIPVITRVGTSTSTIRILGGGSAYFQALLVSPNDVDVLGVRPGQIDVAGNVIVGATAAGATAAKVVALSNAATAPTTSVDLAHVYAEDISAGNCALAVYAEAAASAAVAAPSTHKIPVRYNGTTYYLLASNV